MQDGNLSLMRDLWGQHVFAGDLLACTVRGNSSLVEAVAVDAVNGYVRVTPLGGDLLILVHPHNILKKPILLRTLQLVEN